MTLPADARRILADGTLCFLAAPSPAGPHVTPVVFVLDGDRVWGTTSRGTTKAKLWRRDPSAGGLVRLGSRALSFRGRVTLYDALDPGTWAASLRRGPQVAGASVRFSLKNARFFAGYARDVTRIPLAWSPPARVIFSVDLDDGVQLDAGGPGETWGSWSSDRHQVPVLRSFRRTEPGLRAADLPAEIREVLDTPGDGIVALEGGAAPAVFPVRWSERAGSYFAVVREEVLALAGGLDRPASLVVDRASSWRAARMRGVLLRGPCSAYRPSDLRSGRGALEAVVGDVGEEDVVLRIRPWLAVWWSGWASGTVRRP